MKKILATSILFTLFVTASGCGHMMGHKHDSSHKDCACEKAGAKCACEGSSETAKKDQKKASGCTECAKGS
jgi:hypothetical protein